MEYALIIHDPGSYVFGGLAFGNGTSTVTDCSGHVDRIPAPIDAGTDTLPSFSLPTSVGQLSQTSYDFTAPDFLQASTNWSLSFTATPDYNPDDDCQQDGGSTVGCQTQTLGEDVPIVGTGFLLHYESGRAPGAGGNTIASADAAMISGWTLSVHHTYDPGTNTLFLGDGTQRNGYQLGTPVSFNGNLLVTSQDGREVYVFTSKGQHLRTLRPLTGALVYKFNYNTAGQLVTVTDASGNVTTIRRNASGQPTAIVSPYGQTTTLHLDSHGFLSEVIDPLGKSATFVNSNTGLLESRTDENGNIFHYTYDSNGRLRKDADPLGGFTELTRTNSSSGLGWTVEETTFMGRTSSYQSTFAFPWVQNSATATYSEQKTNTWPEGLQATSNKKLQNGQITESVSLPDGTSSSATSGPDPVWGIQKPVIRSETLTEGTLTMNITGNRGTTLGSSGNPFTVTKEINTQTINGRNYTSTFTGSTRTWVNTTPEGRTLTASLDTLERIASTQIEGLTTTTFVYDNRGRLASATQGPRKTTFTYDADGFLASVTDSLNHKTSFAYDGDGNLLDTTLPDGRIIRYAYDANGNLASVTPPGKSAHDFAHNAVDQLSHYLPPAALGSGSTTYNYNFDRDITTITRPDAKVITYDYDSAGRVKSLITPTETIDYVYSPTTGNLTSASITSGEALAFGYNGPLPTSAKWMGTISGTVSRVYNDNFWVTSQSVNSANTIGFSYDNDGLVSKAGALTVHRNSQNGLIMGTTLGGATDSRTYNSFGELTGYAASYNGTALDTVTYTRDADGRVSEKMEAIGRSTSTYIYSYDLSGRLAGVTKNGTVISTYSYDTNSNRLKATTKSGTAIGTYDAQDRLLTYGAAMYTYSANGELAMQTVSMQKTTYDYDVLGNLVSVTLPSGKMINYVVDAENRRVGKKVNGVLAEGFLYNGGRIVAELNGSNQLVSQFVYATDSTSPDYMVSGGVTYRIFSDQLGSPELVVNTVTGAIAEQITYDEFGNVLSDTNPGFQPFGFAGGLYDQDTKLVRFGARDYNSAVGRWTAKDPILFAGGDTNLYSYVLNDPISLVDPGGLDSAVLNFLTDPASQAFAQNYQSDPGVLTVVIHGSNTPGKVYINNKTEVNIEDLARKIDNKNASDSLLHGTRYNTVHLIVCHGNKGKPSVKRQLQNVLGPKWIVKGQDEALTITSDGHVSISDGGAVTW
jgi:RHS repeat-associated protein